MHGLPHFGQNFALSGSFAPHFVQNTIFLPPHSCIVPADRQALSITMIPSDCSVLLWYHVNDVRVKNARRIVPYFVLPQFCPIFAYREASAPLLCSYRGGSLSRKTTPVQARRGFRLLTLALYKFYHSKISL